MYQNISVDFLSAAKVHIEPGRTNFVKHFVKTSNPLTQ